MRYHDTHQSPMSFMNQATRTRGHQGNTRPLWNKWKQIIDGSNKPIVHFLICLICIVLFFYSKQPRPCWSTKSVYFRFWLNKQTKSTYMLF